MSYKLGSIWPDYDPITNQVPAEPLLDGCIWRSAIKTGDWCTGIFRHNLNNPLGSTIELRKSHRSLSLGRTSSEILRNWSIRLTICRR